jgi:hypothetical protein
MRKRNIFAIIVLAAVTWTAQAQGKKESPTLEREVTLYNPYKPSLSDARKKSYLPEIDDSASVNPVFSYDVFSRPFTPTYSIATIKAASLLPDPLPKLYKSYIKLGLGNNNTPLAELSISNHRSKKGAAGFYARHYSSNGKVPLENKQRVFAGFMDNDATLTGKKFFRKSYAGLSASYLQRTGYAYGYDTEQPFDFARRDIRQSYYDIGLDGSFASMNPDSTDLAFNFGLSYDYFRNTADRYLNHAGFNGELSKLYKDFYAGGKINIDHYTFSESLGLDPRYIFTVNPYVRKSSGQWNFNLGLKLSVQKNPLDKSKIYFHPDLGFGFTIIPEYLQFFSELNGRLESNDPLNVISQNPFIVPDGSLFKVPDTNHSLEISAGLKGNNGLGGNYLLSVSYSLVNDMLFYSNVVYPDTASRIERGNHFLVITDDADILNFHGEMSGNFSDRMSFRASANYYKYTLSASPYAWNRPDWDGKLGLYYNLRNKIIAGTEFTALGARKLMISKSPTGWMTLEPEIRDEPVHVNLGISAEYRYTKILSFWIKVNNISWNRYNEWAFYPSQMFNFLAGFTYSL